MHVGVELDDDAAVDGFVLPLFDELFQFAFILTCQDGGDADSQTSLGGVANVLLDPLISLSAAQTIMPRFFTIDGDLEIHMRPVGYSDSPVGDDHVAPEILRTHLDYFLAHQRLATHPTAREKRKAFALHLLKEAAPAFDREVLGLLMFEEVTMMTAQVALVGHIDGTDRVLRDAHQRESRP